jgi:hypothetical protein
LKITLYSYHGNNIYQHIDVEIDTAGNIVVSGFRMPEGQSRLSGDSFSEFSILVSGHHRGIVLAALQTESQETKLPRSTGLENGDREILWLMGRLYGGRLSGYLEFSQLMASNAIPFKHENYT